jgi:hypothetical protein
VWDVQNNESMRFTQRFLQFEAADRYQRPSYWLQIGPTQTQSYPANYAYNQSICSADLGCGRLTANASFSSLENDRKGAYTEGVGSAGMVAIPSDANGNAAWTFTPDVDGSGGLATHLVQAPTATHRAFDVTVRTCPAAGCFAPPPPPPPPPPENNFIPWNSSAAWANLTDHAANPLNTVTYTPLKDGSVRATVQSAQSWSGPVPSAYDNVWIPSWRKVVLDADTPLLGHVIIEGVLLVNGSSSVALSATYLEVCSTRWNDACCFVPWFAEMPMHTHSRNASSYVCVEGPS